MRKIFSFIIVLIITVSFCSSLIAFAVGPNQNTSSETTSSETTSSEATSSDPASSDPASSDTSSEPVYNPSVFVRISSNTTRVKQGATFEVTIYMELSDFGPSQGIKYFDNLKLNYNSSSFTVEKIQPIAITSSNIAQSPNEIKMSFNKAKDPGYLLTANNIRLCVITMRANIDTAAAISPIDISRNTQFYDNNNNQVNASFSSSISMQVVEADSTNAFLRQLTVNEAELSPVFDKNTFSYSITVPYSVTRINVTAIPEDSEAKVHITGTSDLKVGANTVTIAVTAVSGDPKKYVIYVTRKSDSTSNGSDSSNSSDIPDDINSYINEQISIATASREAELIQHYTAIINNRNSIYISVIIVLLLILFGEFTLLILIKFDIIKLKKPKDTISKIEELNRKN